MPIPVLIIIISSSSINMDMRIAATTPTPHVTQQWPQWQQKQQQWQQLPLKTNNLFALLCPVILCRPIVSGDRNNKYLADSNADGWQTPVASITTTNTSTITIRNISSIP